MTLHLHIIILAFTTLGLGVTALIARTWFHKTWAEVEGKRNPKWSMLTYSKDDLPSFYVRAISTVFAMLAAFALIIALVPFNPSYWFLTQEGGTVATISNRFVEGTGDVSGQTYTMTLEGDATPRVITDSRVLGLATGDHVDLTCSLEWVYGGADRSNCYMRSF